MRQARKEALPEDVVMQNAIGQRVRDFRKQRKISQWQLSEFLRTGQSAVSAWERGEAYPSMQAILLMRKSLGMDINWLIDGNSMKDAIGNGGHIVQGEAAVGQLVSCQEQVAQLRAQLLDKEEIIRGKDEIIRLLKLQAGQ